MNRNRSNPSQNYVDIDNNHNFVLNVDVNKIISKRTFCLVQRPKVYALRNVNE